MLISGNVYAMYLFFKWQDTSGLELEILAKPVRPEIIISKLTAIALAADLADSRPD